ALASAEVHAAASSIAPDKLEHTNSAMPSVSTVREVSRSVTYKGASRTLIWGPILAVGVFLMVAVGGGFLAPKPEAAKKSEQKLATAVSLPAPPQPVAEPAAPVPAPAVEEPPPT